MTELRGGAFHVHIQGQDELQLDHDNVMLESCNTSFQVHLQVDPQEFAPLYNLAQAIAAPVLAAAVNAPLLLGKRLWHETRVALFQHAVDSRTGPELRRGQRPRVYFGDGWLKDSILELIRDDIARFRVVLSTELDEDPAAVMARGEAPRLSALRLHNGTIWRWNRGCYGICEGRPHLRIEHRSLPAGPTVVDEVANAALFLGLMAALPAEIGPVDRQLSFDDARGNFFAAARDGLKAQLTWLGGEVLPAAALLRERLLPLAEKGLRDAGLDPEDVARYLGVIAERVRTEQTGARWILASLPALSFAGSAERRDQILTAAMLARQQGGEPVHTWPLSDQKDQARVRWHAGADLQVSECMSTDLFTARPDDLIDLAASVMQWRHVRHVPVEDGTGKLVGLLSHRDILRALSISRRGRADEAQSLTVAALMTRDVKTVTPQTPVRAAIRVMRAHQIGCLPVVEEGRLVGILTEHDILLLSEHLLGGDE
jgi:CBS domain-containing protein